MRQKKERETWLGGYIRHGKKGPTYIIEKWVGGEHYHVSTRCSLERSALKQLERFEAHPAGYEPGGDEPEPERAPIVMTAKLLLEYRDWMVGRPKPTTPEWADNCARVLKHWMQDLAGKDLRDVSMTADLKPALERRKKQRKHRIESIKSFYAWLRREKGLLRYAEDPTLDLPVPQDVAAKTKRRRVVTREHALKVLPLLPEEIRDIMLLQLGTAWHISEVSRFATNGEIVRSQREGLLAVLVTKHKSGELTRSPISFPEHLEAAERILARGRVPDRHRLPIEMKRACTKAGVPQFRLGVMRHSVLTWAVEDGASVQEAAEFAHHRSPTTTRKFYLDVAEPVASVPVLRVLPGGRSKKKGGGAA